MFRKLQDVPECLGNIDGVDYDADISVKAVMSDDNITLGKEYHVHKITSYGDPFDVWVINDKGKEECLGEFFFEDIDEK